MFTSSSFNFYKVIVRGNICDKTGPEKSSNAFFHQDLFRILTNMNRDVAVHFLPGTVFLEILIVDLKIFTIYHKEGGIDEKEENYALTASVSCAIFCFCFAYFHT